MSESQKAINFEVYRLVCELKLMLFSVQNGNVSEEMHDSVLRLLVAMRRYSGFFKLKTIYKLSEKMEEIWRTVVPGEQRKDAVDSILNIAIKISERLAPQISSSQSVFCPRFSGV